MALQIFPDLVAGEYSVLAYTLVSVLFVSLVSFIGVISLSIGTDRLNKILLYLVSFAAGALIGDAFIHLLPEAVEQYGFGINVSMYILSGVLAFFTLEKIVHWHHYHMPHNGEHGRPFAIMSMVGDSLHNFIDGIIIGTSYLVSIPVGVATTIAVIFHEIPQEIGDFGVLLHGGFSKNKALLFNFLTALAAVVGAIFTLLLATYVEGASRFLLPFAVGGFLYVAGSDLIPELHRDQSGIKKSFKQLLALVLGIAVMYGLTFLEA